MYPIGDMMTKIKNAQSVKREHVVIPFSKVKLAIANVLKQEGFIGEIERQNKKSKRTEHEYLSVALNYDQSGQGAISGIKFVTRPSRRMYIGVKDIRLVRSGYGIAVLSTPKGILSSKEARKQKVGGEILFEIW